MAETSEKVASMTALPRETVDRILQARLDFQFALGIAHGDDEDTARGDALRKKYPDLLRPSVLENAGTITNELEATVVQLESGENGRKVVDVIAAEDEVLGLLDPEQSQAYRAWAEKWVK